MRSDHVDPGCEIDVANSRLVTICTDKRCMRITKRNKASSVRDLGTVREEEAIARISSSRSQGRLIDVKTLPAGASLVRLSENSSP